MAKKDTKQVTKEILDVDFDNTSKAMDFDDDGYEEGKSKEKVETAVLSTTAKVKARKDRKDPKDPATPVKS